MFDATYVRAPFRLNTLASGWFAVTPVSTWPSAARLRIQWKVCALLSPSSEVYELFARNFASAASGSPRARYCHSMSRQIVGSPPLLRTSSAYVLRTAAG
jgi:hypothetical protein